MPNIVTTKPKRSWFMSLVRDPFTLQVEFVVPLTLPRHMRIVKKTRHSYLRCKCGCERRVTLYWAGKMRNGKLVGRKRRAACIGAVTWARDHVCRSEV
jgi:hypothetical protein